MKSFSVAALLLAAASTATASTCAAENILQACLATENSLMSTCGVNDWDCKCNAQNLMVVCYNNCPNDDRRASAEGQAQIYCGYASQYPSSTKAKAVATSSGAAASASTTASGSASAATTTNAATTATSTSASSGSSTSTSARSTATADSGASPLQAGGLLAVAAAGAVAALL